MPGGSIHWDLPLWVRSIRAGTEEVYDHPPQQARSMVISKQLLPRDREVRFYTRFVSAFESGFGPGRFMLEWCNYDCSAAGINSNRSIYSTYLIPPTTLLLLGDFCRFGRIHVTAGQQKKNGVNKLWLWNGGRSEFQRPIEPTGSVYKQTFN